jgi:PEP-CTERM motif
MKKLPVIVLAALGVVLWCAQPTLADDITTTIGSQHFTSGTTTTTGAFNTAVSGQAAPFNAYCGSDINANCSASWIFNYTIPAGDTITDATLTLGIYDIDSKASGNQIASFTLDGTDDLTALLNTASEGLNGGTGAINAEYDVLSITIPASDFTDLGSGIATFALALQGPGLGVLGNTADNGAGLDFSTLDITATPGSNGGGTTSTPEPSSLLLLGMGLLALGTRRFTTKLVPGL